MGSSAKNTPLLTGHKKSYVVERGGRVKKPEEEEEEERGEEREKERKSKGENGEREWRGG